MDHQVPEGRKPSGLGVALAISIAFHLALVYGVRLAPPQAPAATVSSVLEARLVPAQPRSQVAAVAIVKPSPRPADIAPAPAPPSPAVSRATDASPSPVTVPQRAETVAAGTPVSAEKRALPEGSDAPVTQKPSPLPAVSMPLAEDPTYYPAKQVDVHPEPLQPVNPQYPEAAAAANIQGEVILLLLIDESGRVRDVSVVEAKPEGYFEQSALDAFRIARFSPAMKNGRPVKSRVLIHVNYTLNQP